MENHFKWQPYSEDAAAGACSGDQHTASGSASSIDKLGRKPSEIGCALPEAVAKLQQAEEQLRQERKRYRLIEGSHLAKIEGSHLAKQKETDQVEEFCNAVLQRKQNELAAWRSVSSRRAKR